MSPLISCKSVAKSFGAQTLFQNISLIVDSGDKIGVIGPNGSGKSTLLKIICGLEEPDSGQLIRQKFVRLSYLAQDDVFDETQSIRDNLLADLPKKIWTIPKNTTGSTLCSAWLNLLMAMRR